MDRRTFKRARERVHQAPLVLVDLRALRMAEPRLPRVCIRRTAVGAPPRQELLRLQKAPWCELELRRWDDPGQVDWSHPQESGGIWSRLASLPGLADTSCLLLQCGLPVSCGGVVSVTCSN